MSEQTTKKKQYGVIINTTLCKACGYCAESCKKNVFLQMKDFNGQGYQPFNAECPANCIGCLSCLAVCPEFAITIEEK